MATEEMVTVYDPVYKQIIHLGFKRSQAILVQDH